MRKKILFVLAHFRYSNGVAAALLNLIANMNIEKYDIHVLALYEFDVKFASPIMDRITVVPGLNMYFRGLDKIVNLIPGRLLYRQLVKETYDLEVAFQYGMPTKIIAKGNNQNRICWMHGFDFDMKQRRYYKKYKKIISVSKAGRDRLINLGFSKEETDYCYNIIDENRILEQSKEEVDCVKRHRYVIVTVGRLSPEKGCMRYLEAIRDVIEHNKNAEFWIIGDGVEKTKMEDYINRYEMTDYVKLLGMKTNPFKYIKEADVYYCVSYKEGFSTSCQEASILGVPVVSVAVDGAEELINLAGCGRVIENSKEAIAESLIALLEDKQMIDQWHHIAKERAKMFYKEKRIEKAEALLH